ncbi:MAG: hypothetical protein KQI35_07260 [Bacteroidetes bacterium]|nr:hypothetical protein [Bacteroidota bacterium]
MNKNNQNKYNTLRQTYSKFVFEGYHITDIDDILTVAFDFNIDDKHFFKPTLTIPKKALLKTHHDPKLLESLIFHIGMIELISYWKVACPQKVIIKPYFLDSNQIKFWKKLYFKGLGEFFYVNGINEDQETYMQIETPSSRKLFRFKVNTDPQKVIVPIGGGKDSAVTLELLRSKMKVIPFSVNPRKAVLDTTHIGGFKRAQIFEVNRNIDPHLLEMNKQGFLNGHTPFSALLGFITLMAATLSHAKYIALSNESSANEPTIKDGPNHQYSKSIEFENDFRQYVAQFISRDIEYFSFLRPLNEYGIARLFSGMKDYHSAFRSCNAGSKNDRWCGKCSKCLFTYIILSPFLKPSDMQSMFGRNLFDDVELIPFLNELSGIAEEKPFECVGTTDEVNFALQRTIPQFPKPLPPLLKYYQENNSTKFSEETKGIIENAFDNHHFLDDPFLTILKSALND